MKKYIIVIGIFLLASSCRKNVEVKFPTGIYEFTFDMYITKYSGGIYHDPFYKFPAKLIEANNEELKMQYYEIKLGSGDTAFSDISTFYIKKKKFVEGKMYRSNSLESSILFTNGEILRKENKIIGDFSYKIALDIGGGELFWKEATGTYTFSKKE